MELGSSLVMANVLISISDHRTTSIPALLPHNVNFFGQKSIRRSNYRTNIEIMLEVFNGHMKAMAALIEFFHNCFEPPIPKFIDHISAVAFFKKYQIKPIILGPRQRMWANSYRDVMGIHTADDSLH